MFFCGWSDNYSPSNSVVALDNLFQSIPLFIFFVCREVCERTQNWRNAAETRTRRGGLMMGPRRSHLVWMSDEYMTMKNRPPKNHMPRRRRINWMSRTMRVTRLE